MNNIKKYIPFIAAIGIACLVVISVLSIVNGLVNLNISKMEEQNEALKKNNQVLLNEIQVFKDSLHSTNIRIERMYHIEQQLAENYLQLKKSINNLKPQYEKAANYPANFNSDSVRWYFSNLK